MQAADVAARFATGSDLIQALTMRGHEKASLKDFKVRFTAYQALRARKPCVPDVVPLSLL